MKLLLDLPWRSCHWPVAEQAGQHLFCGEPLGPDVDEKCFYCAAHEKRSRVPTKAHTDSQAGADALTRNERAVVKGDPDAVKDLVEEMGEE